MGSIKRKMSILIVIVIGMIIGSFVMNSISRDIILTAEEKTPIFDTLNQSTTWPLVPTKRNLHAGETAIVVDCIYTKHYQVYRIQKENKDGYILSGKYRLSKPC